MEAVYNNTNILYFVVYTYFFIGSCLGWGGGIKSLSLNYIISTVGLNIHEFLEPDNGLLTLQKQIYIFIDFSMSLFMMKKVQHRFLILYEIFNIFLFTPE